VNIKVIYVSVSGRAIVEDINSNMKLVEEPDGLHPLQPSNVWRNDAHRIASFGPDDSIAVIWQGITSPESFGEGLTKEFVSRQITDDFILKLHASKQHISRYFLRTLGNYLATGMMLFFASSIVVILGFFVYAMLVVFLL